MARVGPAIPDIASSGKPAVGLFVDHFPALSQTFVVNEALALAELGHEVSVEARRRPDEAR